MSNKNNKRGDDNNAGLDVVEQFDSYEDYLDSQLTTTDLYYLEDEDIARQLVELGYRGNGDVMKKEVFYDILYQYYYQLSIII